MIYEKVIRPILFKIEPERSHQLALSTLHLVHSVGRSVLRTIFDFEHPALKVKAFNLNFSNPIGLAAGFDKEGRYIEALASLGFGFMEIGSVTFHPQLGNPKPRILRLPKENGLWNHLGFNNDGAERVAARLKQLKLKMPLGINLGKSKIASLENAVKDYIKSFKLLNLFSDYIVLNISSPNTPGVRTLQEKEKLSHLLKEIEEHNTARKPILLKISPELTPEALTTLMEVGSKYHVQGFVVTNTTVSREGIKRKLPTEGGISGRPLQHRSTELVRMIYKNLGKKTCIIGCGGIFGAKDAYEKIKAGASLIQVYTGLVYRGPLLIRKIKHGLVELLHRDGFQSIEEAIGTGVN